MTTEEIKGRLKERRNEILRAELAGWLHSAGRLHPDRNKSAFAVLRLQGITDKLKSRAASGSDAAKRLERLATQSGPFSTDAEAGLEAVNVAFPSEDSWTVAELGMLWNRPFVIQDQVQGFLAYRSTLTTPAQALCLFNASHRRASRMKSGVGNIQGEKVNSTRHDVFGFESKVTRPDDLNKFARDASAYGYLPQSAKREKMKEWLKKETSRCHADDRIPIDDVTVWDYSRSVAAFFKSAVAKAWIEGQLPPNAADVKWGLIGVGYPGLEFVSNALRITDAIARRGWINEKLDALREIFEFEYPFATEIYRDENGAVYLAAQFKGLEDLTHAVIRATADPDDDLATAPDFYFEHNEILPISEAIARLPTARAIDPGLMREHWSGRPSVLCPVCQLRPKASRGTAEEQYVCEVCHKRRRVQERSRSWLRSTNADTIWIDETTDENGICALITGRLDLKDWLSETKQSFFSLLTTTNDGVNRKAPEFLRVEACWATSQEFWEEIKEHHLGESRGERYRLFGKLDATPLDAHVYEATIQGEAFYAVWDRESKAFVTASRFAKQLIPKIEETKVTFYEPSGYEIKEDAGRYEQRETNRKGIVFELTSKGSPEKFRPAIPILTEPQHFLAIVPGKDAPGICEKIIEQYRTRLGKVWTLLPMSLGMVFFDRKTPIYAVFQAGRKMLRIPTPRVNASGDGSGNFVFTREGVEEIGGPGPIDSILMEDRFFSRVAFSKNGESIAIKDALGTDFRVSISQIDYCHLETTGQRYRLAYSSEDGLRLERGRGRRPLTVSQFYGMEKFWRGVCSGLSQSQINQLFSVSEQKREDWSLGCPTEDEAYLAFVRAVLRQAEWKHRPVIERIYEMAKQIADGMLRDAVELHFKVLKERIEN